MPKAIRGDNVANMRSRKNQHLEICLSKPIEAGLTGFEKFHLQNRALPEIDHADVNISATFLGKIFSAPFLITGMTGGVKYGQVLNEHLAVLANKYQIPMGVGSQKIMLRDASAPQFFELRKRFPHIFLIGNLGATEFRFNVTLDNIKRLIDELELNAFAFHLNALQECIQPEGQACFKGVLEFIETAVKKLPVPILVKEVGSGINASDFISLAEIGVQAIDVGGCGGTSWSLVESYRAAGINRRLGDLFKDWGLPTAVSLVKCAKIRNDRSLGTEIIATGGLRNGIDAAKALALGANMVGIGLPFLQAVFNKKQNKNPFDLLSLEMEFFIKSLKIAMFCCGAKTIGELKHCIEIKAE